MKYALVFTFFFFAHCLSPTTSLAIIHPINTPSNSSIILHKKMSLKEKISQKVNHLKNMVIQEDPTTYTEEEKKQFGKESLISGIICLSLFLVAALLSPVSLGALIAYAVLAIPFVTFFLSISAITKGKKAGRANKNAKTGKVLGFIGLLRSILGIIIIILYVFT